ncbi:MAG: DNA-directed RNA polymerase subunit beta', partial [Burkholderiales bacterium]
QGAVDLQALVTVRTDKERIETTVGRVLLYEVAPPEIPFKDMNRVMKKKELANLIDVSYRLAGNKATVIFADRLKDVGFHYATKAGISIAIKDMVIPPNKEVLLKKAHEDVREIEEQYKNGLITDGERYNKVVDIWAEVTDRIADEMLRDLGTETMTDEKGGKVTLPSFNPIFMMADSGARGSAQQIRQLAGMRGLMAKPSGEIIETPITANFREGLTVLQYFISTHGARKGLADTALKTANSGYLTRRLVDVTQDLVVTEDDCGTQNGVSMKALVEGGEVVEALKERILGRVLAIDLVHPETQDILFPAGALIDEDGVDTIDSLGIDEVKVRTALSCDTRWGVCSKCYGRDLGRGSPVNVGEAIGVIAAQSIGEPGTQLTMRTFHIGGAAQISEQSFIESNFEGRIKIKQKNIQRNRDGDLIAMVRNMTVHVVDDGGIERAVHRIQYGARMRVDDGDKIERGQRIAEWDPYT